MGLTTYKWTKQIDKQTDQATCVLWGEKGVREEESGFITAPWCCIRQLSTPAVAPLVNDALRCVVDRLVQVSMAVQ